MQWLDQNKSTAISNLPPEWIRQYRPGGLCRSSSGSRVRWPDCGLRESSLQSEVPEFAPIG